MARYTFGDDTPAVERLALVAQAYEPVSRAFLAANGTVLSYQKISVVQSTQRRELEI